MTGSGNGGCLSRNFCITYRAINNGIVFAFGCARRINIVFNNCFRIGMTGSGNGFLRYENCSTTGTFLTGSKTGLSASGFYFGNDVNGMQFAFVTQSRNDVGFGCITVFTFASFYAVFSFGGRSCGFPLAKVMAFCCYFFLSNKNFATSGTVRTFGKACAFASGGFCCVNNGGVTISLNGGSNSRKFLCTYQAVNYGIVAAVNSTRGSIFVFENFGAFGVINDSDFAGYIVIALGTIASFLTLCSASRSGCCYIIAHVVAIGFNGFLGFDCFATNGAFLTVGQTVFGASCSLAGNGFFGVGENSGCTAFANDFAAIGANGLAGVTCGGAGSIYLAFHLGVGVLAGFFFDFGTGCKLVNCNISLSRAVCREEGRVIGGIVSQPIAFVAALRFNCGNAFVRNLNQPAAVGVQIGLGFQVVLTRTCSIEISGTGIECECSVYCTCFK